MDIKIIDIKDQPDGSAIIDVEMSEETKDLLIQYALLDMIKKGIETVEEK